MEIVSKDEFWEYEITKQSGVTNMCLINQVCDLTGLSRAKVLYIQKEGNYKSLCDKYKGDNENENNNEN